MKSEYEDLRAAVHKAVMETRLASDESARILTRLRAAEEAQYAAWQALKDWMNADVERDIIAGSPQTGQHDERQSH